MESRQRRSYAGEPMSPEAQKRSIGHQRAQYTQKRAENKLRKTLASPSRKEQEDAFATAHREDSDQVLYEYVKAQKRQLGKQMKPVNTVGYNYIVERLGPWPEIMRRVNRDLEME